jgi:DNA-binding NarL/FixJ family response regulator
LFKARGAVDVAVTAPRVGTRTLVIHARGDRVVPVQEGRLLAKLIPNARLVVLDSANHILLEGEPAWEQFVSALRGFLCPPGVSAPSTSAAELSPRELEVLELVAAGLANEAIAERLSLSVRTVERHLSNVYAKLRLSGKAARAAAAVSFIKLRTSSGEQLR